MTGPPCSGSRLAARRLVLVLDNAADEGQVRPLLPGSGSCITLVTSRASLAGLTGVHRVELPLLRREEGVRLLTRIVGTQRVAAEAQAARDLADLCGGLPLAVRIAGQRLAARPQQSLTKLAARLRREERRLDALQAGDLQVRAAFALSYRQLGPVSRRVLRRCALATGPDVSPETVSLLADSPSGLPNHTWRSSATGVSSRRPRRPSVTGFTTFSGCSRPNK